MSAAARQRVPAAWFYAALSVGALGLLTAIVAGCLRPRAFYYGYVCGFLLWTGVPLGGAGLLMLHHLTGGRWGWSIRRPVDAAVASVPLILLAFIPIALGLRQLYPWATQAFPDEPRYAFRAWYLQAPFFYLRAAIILGLWVVGGLLLRTLTRRQERAPSAGGWLVPLSAVGLITYFVTVAFAGIDWILTLERDFYSSVFGFYIVMGQALTALAVFIILQAGVARLRGAAPLSRDQLADLGNLLMAFVILHTYIAYSQFFIIWNGNLPDHATWYAPRTRGGWGVLAVVQMVLHFFLPMFALFFRAVKRDVRMLVTVASIVLVARVLDSAWMVLPSAHDNTWLSVLSGFAAMLGVGGIWVAVLLWGWEPSAALPEEVA